MFEEAEYSFPVAEDTSVDDAVGMGPRIREDMGGGGRLANPLRGRMLFGGEITFIPSTSSGQALAFPIYTPIKGEGNCRRGTGYFHRKIYGPERPCKGTKMGPRICEDMGGGWRLANPHGGECCLVRESPLSLRQAQGRLAFPIYTPIKGEGNCRRGTGYFHRKIYGPERPCKGTKMGPRIREDKGGEGG